MAEEKPKFQTTDKPLSASQAEEIGKIRVKDVKQAISSSDRGLRSLLNAKIRRKS